MKKIRISPVLALLAIILTGSVLAQERPLSQRLGRTYHGPSGFIMCATVMGTVYFRIDDAQPTDRIKIDTNFPLVEHKDTGSCGEVTRINPKSLAARLCAVGGVSGGEITRYGVNLQRVPASDPVRITEAMLTIIGDDVSEWKRGAVKLQNVQNFPVWWQSRNDINPLRANAEQW